MTDRNAQTLAAREARKMPSGNISREVTIQGTLELMERIKSMSSAERGEAINRGTIEFPWKHYEMLCHMMGHIEAAVEQTKI
jgi:hypothetical protein